MAAGEGACFRVHGEAREPNQPEQLGDDIALAYLRYGVQAGAGAGSACRSVAYIGHGARHVSPEHSRKLAIAWVTFAASPGTEVPSTPAMTSVRPGG